ncbi:MAG TPA: tRNA pseudouridine(13) synthase TruD [Polyangiaceae bacterium]|nr:tRNA pseudouridine(13) synthase TruD [Polyangiaceae bacterium]
MTTNLLASADLVGTGGRIGPEPEDFVVEEVPAYEPSGEGEHLYLFVQKRQLTTPECVDHLARASGVHSREIGYAGLKDKHAVTTQWISLPARGVTDPASWQLPSSIRLLKASKHNNKLRTGHLQKNKFRIRIVEGNSNAQPLAQAIATHLDQHGLFNYFGAQRFGRGGNNLASALHWLRTNPGRSSRFHRKLYPSVIQSEVFNRFLNARQQLGFQKLMLGEVVRLGTGHSVFCVQDLAAEQPRYESGELHLTGPIVGPKTKQAEGAALELEQRTIEEVGLSADDLTRLSDFAPGARRDLLVRPEQLVVESDSTGALVLSFALPPGSYATELVREFTRQTPAHEAKPDAQRSAAD